PGCAGDSSVPHGPPECRRDVSHSRSLDPDRDGRLGPAVGEDRAEASGDRRRLITDSAPRARAGPPRRGKPFGAWLRWRAEAGKSPQDRRPARPRPAERPWYIHGGRQLSAGPLGSRDLVIALDEVLKPERTIRELEAGLFSALDPGDEGAPYDSRAA